MKKRLTSLLLCFSLLMLCIPFAALTAGAATMYVDRITVEIDVPVDGVELKTTASLTAYCDYLNAAYPASAPAVKINSVAWYKKGTGTPLANNTKAVLGQTYVCTIMLVANDGYAFRDNMAQYDNRINDLSTKAEKWQAGSVTYWSFSIEFTAIAAVNTAPTVVIKEANFSPYQGQPMEVIVSANGTNLKYEWQFVYGDSDGGALEWGGAIALSDNARYRGCTTNHFKMHTFYGDTWDYDLSWAKIRCKVTSDAGVGYSPEFWYYSIAPEVLSSASVSGITAPVSGKSPSYSATAGSSNYTVSEIEWFLVDGDDKVELDKNDIFVAGDYICRVHILPNIQYRFNDSTTVTVNGKKQTLTTINGESLDIYGADRYYVDVSYEVEASTDILGFQTYLPAVTATQMANRYTELGDIPYGNETIFGFKARSLSSSLIAEGYSIKETARIVRTGYGDLKTFSSGAQFNLMDYITAIGKYQVWFMLDLYKDGEYVTSYGHIYNMNVVTNVISNVNVSIAAPEIGGSPENSATAGGIGYKVLDVDWCYDDGSGEFATIMPSGMVFEDGKSYMVYIKLAPESGFFSFPEKGSDLTATINGRTASVNTINYSADRIYIELRFDMKKPEIIDEKIDITFKKPTAGEAIYDGVYVSSDKVAIGLTYWYRFGTTDELPYAHQCVEGKDYFLVLELYSASGYSFGDMNDDEWRQAVLDNITFNGEPMLACIESREGRLILASPVYTATGGILGDVNNDGAIDQYDYILVKRHYFGTRILTDDEMTRADVNADDVINQYDYILIKRHYFGTYTIG